MVYRQTKLQQVMIKFFNERSKVLKGTEEGMHYDPSWNLHLLMFSWAGGFHVSLLT